MITPLPPYPAALVKTQKTRAIVIADLHIGWEVALSRKGIHVPTQTPKLLKKLMDLVSTYKPEKILIIGDVKHTIATAETLEWHDIPDFFSALDKQVHEISVVPGNHDGNLEPLLPDDVRILPSTGVVMGDTGFFHGHRWPSPALLKCSTLVMGHVHPVIAFRDPSGFRVTRQVWVKASCNGTRLAEVLLQRHRVKVRTNVGETLAEHYGVRPRASHVFIMPSFNDFLGGRPLNERKGSRYAKSEVVVGPVLRSEAVDMKNAETYLLDGTFLGTLEQLKALS